MPPTGFRTLKSYTAESDYENFDDDILQKLYQPPFEVAAKQLIRRFKDESVPNKYYINAQFQPVCPYRTQSGAGKIQTDRQGNCLRHKPRNAEQTFAVNALCNTDIRSSRWQAKPAQGKRCWLWAGALQVRKNYRPDLYRPSCSTPQQ